MAIPAIRPISDLRTDLNSVCDEAHESRRPIFMTKNGKASLVVMDCDAYEQQQQHERYVLKLREAEIEARYQKDAVSMKEMNDRIGSIIAFASKSHHANA